MCVKYIYAFAKPALDKAFSRINEKIDPKSG